MKSLKDLRLSSLLSLKDRRSSIASPSTSSYVDIPGGKKKKNKTPAALATWRFAAATSLMFSLAIALEIALIVSIKQQGFTTGKMTTGKVQFYSSFIPTLSITGLAYYWRSLDRAYRRMQPYINMSRGPAKAQDSVLLDMEHMNFMKLLKVSLATGRYIVLISTIFAFLGILYHPLASSLFFVKSVRFVSRAATDVQSVATLGLNPVFQDLSSFVAAAGFSEAAAFYDLDNPPFVSNSWAVARFQYPSDITVNSSVTVNTTAIQSQLNCSSVPVDVLINSPQSPNTTLQVDIAPGCSRSVTIVPSSSNNQYGAQAITNCTPNAISPEFAPVLFWFYTIGSGTGQIIARSVFCEVSLKTAAVEVTVDGTTGLLTSLIEIGNVPPNENNITSGAFSGDAFNGITFDSQNPAASFNLSNPFIAARALAVQTQIPGAIFRLATDATLNPGGFSEQGILNITQSIYTQYLSIIALGNYFVPASQSLVADVTLWPNRLFMNNTIVHVLSVLLLIVAFTEIVLYCFYRRRSRDINLGTRPGFIAHCMSILPHANTSFITPTDDKQSLKRKLDKLQFMLDDDGYIIALPISELDAVRKSRGASWLSQQKSMLKFHIEPYEEISPFSPKSDDDDTWLSVSPRSFTSKSALVTPLPSASFEPTSPRAAPLNPRKGSSAGRTVRFSSKTPSPLAQTTFEGDNTVSLSRERGSVESVTSSRESHSQISDLSQRSPPALPPGITDPPTFRNPFLHVEDSSSSSESSLCSFGFILF